MWQDILKKNVVSILCGVIALVAIVLTFVPADGWITDLKSQLDARGAVNATLAGLGKKTRNLPILVPGATEATPMAQFPSETVIAQGEQATKAVKLVSQKLFNAAVTLNQTAHPPLVPNVLPRSSDVPKLQFRGAYVAAFKFAPDRQTPQLPDYNIPVSILRGTQPPTPEQVLAAQEKLWVDKYNIRIIEVNGAPANAPQVTSEYIEEGAKLPQVLREKAATESKVYIMPGALQVNPNIQGVGMPPREEEIWVAQLSLWIQTDVARAIANANAKSERGILDAPVKQLLSLVVGAGNAGGTGGPVMARPAMGPGGYPGAPRMPGGDDGSGAGATKVSDPAETLTFDYVTSPTGRVNSGLYDVYDFQLTVDVDASQLPAFIGELTRNQYCTVRWLNFTPVNLTELKSAGFLYGDKPVVRVVLVCETLFLRKWTEPLMPDSIKAALGIAPPVAAETAQ